MKLIVTIDTEEDDWGRFEAQGHTVENVCEIPEVQSMFDKYQIRPTYLINYPVANDSTAISILGEILKNNKCEIGAHCHPWNTPPFSENLNEKNSMLCNLPVDLNYSKIKNLTSLIEDKLMIRPVSFRSGRWGFNQDVANCLIDLGYKVDTSITSYTDWRPFYGPDFSKIGVEPFYYVNQDLIAENASLLEIPASVGYKSWNFELQNTLFRFSRLNRLKKLRLLGLLDKLGLVKRIVLSPELSTAEEMIQLTNALSRRGAEFINLYFHSPTLRIGATKYVRNKVDKDRFLNSLERYFQFTNKSGIQSITLSETVDQVQHPVDSKYQLNFC